MDLCGEFRPGIDSIDHNKIFNVGVSRKKTGGPKNRRPQGSRRKECRRSRDQRAGSRRSRK